MIAVKHRVAQRLRCVDRARRGDFRPGVKSWGLRCEVAAIVELATRLAAHLRAGDPLASRVKLGKGDFFAALLLGTWRGSWR